MDMRWYIANITPSAELAITISYQTSMSGIVVLLKTPKEIPQLIIAKKMRTTNILVVTGI